MEATKIYNQLVEGMINKLKNGECDHAVHQLVSRLEQDKRFSGDEKDVISIINTLMLIINNKMKSFYPEYDWDVSGKNKDWQVDYLIPEDIAREMDLPF
ncbi:MAG: hypothetical protein ACOCRX_00700 [Candidatus Woesearchaeota archaeon]